MIRWYNFVKLFSDRLAGRYTLLVRLQWRGRKEKMKDKQAAARYGRADWQHLNGVERTHLFTWKDKGRPQLPVPLNLAVNLRKAAGKREWRLIDTRAAIYWAEL
jgi:hypothetical protein